ncbi:hypothetical protein A5772_19735 [Mycolicibacter sinensis]|uniref:Uncharacterized protein n=1 Tax=Mycolicibacter sinensis (strain JDM601) TaxID=875328 RepID=A0A1A2ESM2_MYCSD|nr:hypothetical protein A5771_10065 [Mycolicibacter sinensis]OBG07140.1 hypothetical protein A5772_19735 [Mycolicibacter sinensis]
MRFLQSFAETLNTSSDAGLDFGKHAVDDQVRRRLTGFGGRDVADVPVLRHQQPSDKPFAVIEFSNTFVKVCWIAEFRPVPVKHPRLIENAGQRDGLVAKPAPHKFVQATFHRSFLRVTRKSRYLVTTGMVLPYQQSTSTR